MPTLSDQLSVPDSPDLRDLLKSHRRRRGVAGEAQTLASAVSSPSTAGGRTLLDILHDEEVPFNGGNSVPVQVAVSPPSEDGGNSVRFQVAVSPPSEDGGNSVGFQVAVSPPSEDGGNNVRVQVAVSPPSEDIGRSADAAAEDRPASLSLMELLEQTEWQDGSIDGVVVAAEAETETEAAVEMEGEGLHVCRCCVCMVRHKGAAFVPCGHTYCRVCARKLRARRGSCPLCNAAILDILDLY